MNAVIYTKYGSPDVLRLAEVEKPTPKDHEVLVKVRATTVTAGDTRMRSFTVPLAQWVFARLYLGVTKPRRAILGMELAGEVVAVGKSVTQFKPGDAIFALTMAAGFGGYAEYKCLPEKGYTTLKPHNLSFEEAAALPVGGLTALGMVRKTNIQRGQKVLIYGASGSVGTFAIQFAKHAGAEVVGVCSTANVDLVKSLGADRVIDYTKEAVARNSDSYDVILDAVGKADAAHLKKALQPNGTYLSVIHFSDKPKPEAMLTLKEMAEQGHLRVVIDRQYPMAQIVEAHEYVDKGHKRGNVIIRVPG